MSSNTTSINLPQKVLSTIARLGPGSAARSIHGGFVYWHRGISHETSFAEQICGPNDFDINAIIAIVDKGKKDITSDVGHESVKTSIFDRVRVKKSQEQAEEIKKAILDDNFTKVGTITEENCIYMHAVMMTSKPALFYWNPFTLRIIKKVIQIRKSEKLECFFTIDAGPNVYCLCRPEIIENVQNMLGNIEGIKETILLKPARDSYTTNKHLF